MQIGEYEAVRTSFDRFLIAPGHEIDEVEEVVERHPRYLVVVKQEPEARKMAKVSDTRRWSSTVKPGPRRNRLSASSS